MQLVEAAIRRGINLLGADVTVKGPEGEIQTKAIIDPVESVSQAARTATGLADGYLPPGSYQYYGLPEVDLRTAKSVSEGENHYYFRRKELYQSSGIGLYWWGLLIRGGDENDGTETAGD